ncbi:hypothetical protein LJC20_05355 [Eubacteriales bacterium OttesenSCG-928-M02]|nr:hypothetical protein [Eubacteriales bacterium OttesenSCG-928-M02]
MKQELDELILSIAHSFCEGLDGEEIEILGMLLFLIGETILAFGDEQTLPN